MLRAAAAWSWPVRVRPPLEEGRTGGEQTEGQPAGESRRKETRAVSVGVRPLGRWVQAAYAARLPSAQREAGLALWREEEGRAAGGPARAKVLREETALFEFCFHYNIF